MKRRNYFSEKIQVNKQNKDISLVLKSKKKMDVCPLSCIYRELLKLCINMIHFGNVCHVVSGEPLVTAQYRFLISTSSITLNTRNL